MRNEAKKWNGKSRGGALGNGIFVATLKYLGVRPAYMLLVFVAPYFVFFAPSARRSVMKYHRKILGYGRLKSVAQTFALFYRFGQTIIDKIAVKHGITKPYEFDYGTTYNEFLSVLDAGRGAIIIGAHVGSWEVGAPFFFSYGKRMNIVMLDAEYAKIKHVIEQGTDAANFKIIPLGDDGLDSILKIKSALDHGEYVCFQGDRFMNDRNAITTTFLGHEAQFPRGLFKLAAKMRVPIIFYYAMRQRHRKYNFIFEMARMDENGTTTADNIFAQYIASLERIVKKYPQQWFNFYEFWTKYE